MLAAENVRRRITHDVLQQFSSLFSRFLFFSLLFLLFSPLAVLSGFVVPGMVLYYLIHDFHSSALVQFWANTAVQQSHTKYIIYLVLRRYL